MTHIKHSQTIDERRNVSVPSLLTTTALLHMDEFCLDSSSELIFLRVVRNF